MIFCLVFFFFPAVLLSDKQKRQAQRSEVKGSALHTVPFNGAEIAISAALSFSLWGENVTSPWKRKKHQWDLDVPSFVSQTLGIQPQVAKLTLANWAENYGFTPQQSLLNTTAYTHRPVDITHPVAIETQECRLTHQTPMTHETKTGFGEFATILTLSVDRSAKKTQSLHNKYRAIATRHGVPSSLIRKVVHQYGFNIWSTQSQTLAHILKKMFYMSRASYTEKET